MPVDLVVKRDGGSGGRSAAAGHSSIRYMDALNRDMGPAPLPRDAGPDSPTAGLARLWARKDQALVFFDFVQPQTTDRFRIWPPTSRTQKIRTPRFLQILHFI